MPSIPKVPIGAQSRQSADFVMRIDTRQQEAFLRRYTSENVDAVLTSAAAAGAKAGVKVMRAMAPEGKSKRLSQYYRRMGLKHGTLRASIKAAKIRGRSSSLRGLQGNTIGYVIGPIGKNAFTRAWVEFGTAPHDMGLKGRRRVRGAGQGRHPGERGKHWTAAAAGPSFAVARVASEDKLAAYAKVT